MSTKVVTSQIVRDTLIIKGPCTLTELLKEMDLEDDFRTSVHVHLVELQDAKRADYNTETGLWSSAVILSC